MKGTYHYEYAAFTDNLCYGRILIKRCKTKAEAYQEGNAANKGCFIVQKVRVTD